MIKSNYSEFKINIYKQASRNININMLTKLDYNVNKANRMAASHKVMP